MVTVLHALSESTNAHGERGTRCGVEGFVTSSEPHISCAQCLTLLRAAGPDPLPREYTDAEADALRVVSPIIWGQTYQHHRGPAWYACGPAQPLSLRRRAEEWEKQAAAARLVADAMEREGCA